MLLWWRIKLSKVPRKKKSSIGTRRQSVNPCPRIRRTAPFAALRLLNWGLGTVPGRQRQALLNTECPKGHSEVLFSLFRSSYRLTRMAVWDGVNCRHSSCKRLVESGEGSALLQGSADI